MANDLLQTLPSGSIQIFSMTQKLGPIAKSDLCKLTDKKFPTVNHFIEPLMQAKLVTECGVGDSTGGRKPMLYAVAPDGHYLLAASIFSDRYVAAVMNFRMEILLSESAPLEEDHLAEAIAESLRSQLGRLEVSEPQVYGVGVSVPGSMKQAGAQLAEQLGRLLGMPYASEESTSAGALLEYFYGRGRSASKMLYLLCGDKILSALVVDGKLMGSSASAGEALGHMIINFDGEECPCGNFGCVDCYAAIPAVLEKTASELKKGRASVLNGLASRLSLEDICRAAEQGDGLASDALLSAASALGIALANALRLFSPELVVLGGPLAQESQLYYEAAVQVAQKKLSGAKNGIAFSRNGLFPQPALSGAAAVLVEDLLRAGEQNPA